MNEEYCDRILAALDSCFTQMKQDFGAGISKLRQDLQAIAKVLGNVRNRRALKTKLLQAPDPQPEEIAQIIACFELLPWLTKEATRDLPSDPGGRTEKLRPELVDKAINEIKRRLENGEKTWVAMREVASEYRVAERTMWKYWGRNPQSVEYHRREIIAHVRDGAMRNLESTQPDQPTMPLSGKPEEK